MLSVKGGCKTLQRMDGKGRREEEEEEEKKRARALVRGRKRAADATGTQHAPHPLRRSAARKACKKTQRR